MYAGLAAQLPVGRVGEADDVALAYVYAMQQPMATGNRSQSTAEPYSSEPCGLSSTADRRITRFIS
jgi:hypothetical protein